MLNHWTHDVLGLPYIHQRSDRDDHVLIKIDNVAKPMQKYFDIVEDEDSYVEYDHSSFLHPPHWVNF